MTAALIMLGVVAIAAAGAGVGAWAATVHWRRELAVLQARDDALDAAIAGDIRQVRIVKHGH